MLWHWLKEKLLQVAKSCTRSLAYVIIVVIVVIIVFLLNHSFLKCQLVKKKIATAGL